MKLIGRLALGVLVVGGALAIACGLWFLGGGVGARQPPGRFETAVARAVRHRAIPGSVRQLANPFSATPVVLKEGGDHFADHCASCHGNDGKGATEVGRNLSPRVPDMTRNETQTLSDGELFFIIKNGIRLTGMPAWGRDTPEDDRQSWLLVAFIRHLPMITEKELNEMRGMNPVNPMEMKEEKELDDFLEGGDSRSQHPDHNPTARRGP
jgi:mono/diheme cytochrome c family protein